MFTRVKEQNKKATFRLALCSLSAIGVVIPVFFITITRPHHPLYCAKCHDTITFTNACKKPSGDIACIDCHAHGNKVTRVMAEEIRDEHCTSEPCHPLNTLSEKTSMYKNLKPFLHRTHISEFAEGLKLRCTSCHAGLKGEKHFEIDEKTCNTCHFIYTRKPLYTQDKKPISNCILCHGHIEKTKEIYGKTFQHDVYEKNEKVPCSGCHFTTVQGYGEVDRKNCFQCHSNSSNNAQSTSDDIHHIHIDKHETACTSCHAPINHGRVQESSDLPGNIGLESINPAGTVQNLVMMGQGGRGVQGDPDPMYLATLNCSACHKDKQFRTPVLPEVCNDCHGKGFHKIVSEQKHFVTSKMRLLKTLLVKAKRQQNTALTVIQEAEANYNLIREDGSLGAHNIKYIKDLLNYSIRSLSEK